MIRRSWLTALLPAFLLVPALAEGGAEHLLVLGQRALGNLEAPGMEDRVLFRAEEGWTVRLRATGAKGGALRPRFSRLLSPTGTDLLGTSGVSAIPKGNSVQARFVARESGTYVLAISGAGSTTGPYELATRGPAKVPAGTGTVATPESEVALSFEADVGTVLTVEARAARGSTLRPLIARIVRPDGVGIVDWPPASRRITSTSDRISGLALADRGTYSVVVVGAGRTTGAFDLDLRASKSIPLDLTGGPPRVDFADPPSMTIPLSGSSTRFLAVRGGPFQPGATVEVGGLEEGAGISNMRSALVTPAVLHVTFDLSAAATPGPLDVRVTNPDSQEGTLASGLTLRAQSALEVSAVTPPSGPGEGGTRVLVQGALFAPDASVAFGGLPAAAVRVLDSENILCTVPPAAVLSRSAGTEVDVTVDDGAGGRATLSGGFAYDPDAARPKVLGTVPASDSTDVPTNLQAVVFVLSERPDAATVIPGNFDFFRSVLSGPDDVGSPPVASASIGPGGRLVVIRRSPVIPGGGNEPYLSTGSIYRAQIHLEDQASGFLADLAGNELDVRPFSGPRWQSSFTTGMATDDTAPSIASSDPAPGAAGADVDAAVSVTFSEPVDPATVAASVSMSQGGAEVPASLVLDDACLTATLTPLRALVPGAAHEIAVTTALRDLSGNALAVPWTAIFATAASDAAPPRISLTVEGLPQDMNGSGPYVWGRSNGGYLVDGGALLPFDLYLPRWGFSLDLEFSDPGGSGADPATFTFTSSADLGGIGAGQDLAPLFERTPLGARWTVDAGHALPARNDVVFTAGIRDRVGNPAAAASLAVDAADISGVPPGSGTGDRDPFNRRQSWLLRFDQDLWTITADAGGTGDHPSPIAVASSAEANGIPDFQEDLTLVGLNGPETGAGAATVTRGADTGTNAIARTMVREAVRGYVNMRYGIGFSGARDADSPEVEFLLEGEPIASGGIAIASGWKPTRNFSMISLAGDEAPGSESGIIGTAIYDARNASQENDSNTGSGGGNLGIFGTAMIRAMINVPPPTAFAATFDPLIALASRGGTPVGSSDDDAIVLAGDFDYASATPARKARFDAVMIAVDRYARLLSDVAAHEMGHSMGLVPDGAPPAGLFGNAHPDNTFVASAEFTDPHHLDVPGPNLMAASVSFEEAIAGGTDFSLFEPLSLAYLRRRLIYDR